MATPFLVKDINPTGNAFLPLSPSESEPLPGTLAAVGNTLFFSANDGTNSFELWKSDGTEAGTVLVKDIRAGSNSSTPMHLAVLGDTLFFSASNGSNINGYELWKSDGTEAGTVLVKDIRYGRSGSPPQELDTGGRYPLFQCECWEHWG